MTNPYNPFGNRYWSTTGAPNTDGTPRLTGTPSAVSITNKRLTDLATRTDWVDTSVYRGVAGLQCAALVERRRRLGQRRSEQ